MKKSASVLLVLLISCTLLLSSALWVLADGDNFAAGLKWEKFMNSSGDVQVKSDDEGEYYASTGTSSAYGSAGIGILKNIKEALGDEDEVELYLAVEARFVPSGDDDEFPCAWLIRVKDAAEDFADEFEGSLIWSESGGNYYKRITNAGQVSLTTGWKLYEYSIVITQEDVEDGLYGDWFFCMDNMSNVEAASEIDFRNFGIYLSDDYEPAEEKATPAPTQKADPSTLKNTPAPIEIQRPINFDRYPITFGNVKGGDAQPTREPAGYVDAPEQEASASTGEEKTQTISPLLWVGIGGGALVLIAVVVVVCIVVSKKKKGSDK